MVDWMRQKSAKKAKERLNTGFVIVIIILNDKLMACLCKPVIYMGYLLLYILKPNTIRNMNLFTKLTTKAAGHVTALALCFGTTHLQAQFTAGNVVVLQVGDGSAALNSAGTALILKEYTPAGVAGYVLSIPTTTATNGLVTSGSATSEGLISRSSDKSFIIVPGYFANAGTASIAGTTSTVAPRGVGRVSANGTYSLVATSTSFFSGNNIRGAASNGTDYWAAGANDGIDYFGTSAPAATIANTTTNTRAIGIFAGNLMYSTGSGSTTRGIYQISGMPSSGSNTATQILATGSTSSAYGFAMDAGGTIMYVADDRAFTTTSAQAGGIQKYTWNGSAWTFQYTLQCAGTSTIGARGLAVDFSGTNPIVYASTAEGSANRLIAITDAGATSGSSATLLATAATNTIFRGVALSPESCIAPAIGAVSAGSAICAGQTLSLSANTSAGTAPFTYTWTGAGSISSANSSSTSVVNATSGNYTITVSNACGTATAAVTATVNSLPAITTNSATICAGANAILNAGGASTYTWSTTENTQTISVNPTSTTAYTVMGTDANGCVGTNTANVMVNSLPAVTASSATNCAGAPASLTAGGANTYTWSTTATGSTIVVMPASSTNYTVTGTDGNGCANTATASVTTSTLPVITVNTPTTCAGNAATLIASGANTYTWSTTATTFSITDSPMTTATYTVSGTDNNGCVGMATTSIVVNALPAVNSTSATICAGGTATLTASGASTYTWSTTENTSTITASPSAPANYTVTGTDANGCVNMAIGSVNVTSAPGMAVNSATICAGSTATLTASGVSTYTWSNGDNTASTIVSPSSTTVYTVSGQASGCGVVTASNTAAVNVNPLPSVSISSVSPVCINANTVSLSGSPAGGSFMGTGVSGSSFNPAASGAGTFTLSYMYTDANSCSNTAMTSVAVHALPTVSIAPVAGPLCTNSPSFALSGSPAGGSFSGTGVSGNDFSPATAGVGTFTVSYMYTDANSCANSNTTTVTVSSCTGIENIQKDASFSVYPNPAKDVLNVQFDNNGNTVIEVYDALGNMVYTAETSQDHAVINTGSLNKGLYFVRLKGSHIQATSRFIKD